MQARPDGQQQPQPHAPPVTVLGASGGRAEQAVLVAYNWVWRNVDRIARLLGYDDKAG